MLSGRAGKDYEANRNTGVGMGQGEGDMIRNLLAVEDAGGRDRGTAGMLACTRRGRASIRQGFDRAEQRLQRWGSPAAGHANTRHCLKSVAPWRGGWDREGSVSTGWGR